MLAALGSGSVNSYPAAISNKICPRIISIEIAQYSSYQFDISACKARFSNVAGRPEDKKVELTLTKANNVNCERIILQ